MPVPSEPHFHDEKKAFEYLESVQWPHGVACPHCGVVGGRVYVLEGKSTRMGLKKCGECRKQFTVKVGTVFEHARIPLHKMLQAVYLMTGSRKAVSTRDLHRALGVTYKSAWFLARRIRGAMQSGELAPLSKALKGSAAGTPRERDAPPDDEANHGETTTEAARHQSAGRRAASLTRDSSEGLLPAESRKCINTVGA